MASLLPGRRTRVLCTTAMSENRSGGWKATIVAEYAAPSGAVYSRRLTRAGAPHFGRCTTVSEHGGDTDIRVILQLQNAAAIAARALRRAVRSQKFRERMRKGASRDSTYLAMHEALTELADEHASAYQALIGHKYSCPVCFVRHGQHFELQQIFSTDGEALACDGCAYSLVSASAVTAATAPARQSL